MKTLMINTTKKIYKRPTIALVKVDAELSLTMLSVAPGDPGAGFIESVGKFLIR
ncbi:MAG: hypothetical protein RL331_191 [Bacteroidota bacterium]|jgi:hypothetical protein